MNPKRINHPIGAPIVTIANLKGGVGKSTTTLMLAEGLAYRYGLKVLVLDFDAQANLSQLLLTEKGVNSALENAKGIASSLERFCDQVDGGSKWAADDLSGRLVSKDANTIAELIDANRSGCRNGWVSLIPSHFKLRFIEPRLERTPGPDAVKIPQQLHNYIQASLGPLRGQFDIVLIDCPPHVSTLCRAAIKLADYIVTPVIAEELSLWGLKQFVKWLDAAETRKWLGGTSGDISGRQFIVFTKHQKNATSNKIRTNLKAQWHDRSFASPVRYRIGIERQLPRAGADSVIRFKRKYKNDVGEDVEKLCDDFVKFINNKEKTPWMKVPERA